MRTRRDHSTAPWQTGKPDGTTPAGLAELIGNYDVKQFFANWT